MGTADMLLLSGNEIVDLFRGQESALMETVATAYKINEDGDSSGPNCAFLRFPGNSIDRIIPKVAFLGGSFQAAGIKWIASFPANLSKGFERASATIILNSIETGLPLAVMEGSVISAYRTAASAALAATTLWGERPATAVGAWGCGLINFETLRFLLAARPEIETIRLYDLAAERAAMFQHKCAQIAGSRSIKISADGGELFASSDITAIATTAVTPYLDTLCGASDESVILHTSLRDFLPRAVQMADNVVDDVEHACSNGASLDLTAQEQGNRDFIRTTIGKILKGDEPPRIAGKAVMFSPFGLGILDIAVAHLAVSLARKAQKGRRIENFLPTPWTERRYQAT
ncbi:MAG TPA: 2,3-diaminopropionate biosynthesis protein SbnB [Pyrinomonadaceae bacterium]|nr:2,3-diaminopropionate biosynthesis protein SbnB [Pyrinomonadaceae bacterium]